MARSRHKALYRKLRAVEIETGEELPEPLKGRLGIVRKSSELHKEAKAARLRLKTARKRAEAHEQARLVVHAEAASLGGADVFLSLLADAVRERAISETRAKALAHLLATTEPIT